MPDAQTLIEKGFRDIIKGLGIMGYPIKDENFKGTAERCTRAFQHFVFPKDLIYKEIDEFFKVFPSKIDEMVTETNIPVICLCPHHLLPVEMKVTVAYIPNGKVLGLSKMTRIAQMLGNQPILQEEYTNELARLMDMLNPLGVGIYVKGKHGCMRFRGVRVNNTDVITTKFIGNFKNNLSTRNEFLSFCEKNK